MNTNPNNQNNQIQATMGNGTYQPLQPEAHKQISAQVSPQEQGNGGGAMIGTLGNIVSAYPQMTQPGQQNINTGINNPKTGAQAAMGGLSGALSGAAAGSALGPYGAAIGGGIGLLSSLFGK